MRLCMARKLNIEIKNKLTGGKYIVTSVNDNSSTVSRLLADGTVDENEQIEVTEENAICFRFLYDPNPEVLPEGYTVEDGILLKDGKSAT